MPNNVNVVGANLFYVKLQTIAMLIALINGSQTVHFSNDNTTRKFNIIIVRNKVYFITIVFLEEEPVSKVILMKARLHARLFKIIVGTEIISSQDITELMLKGTFPEHITPIMPAIDAVLSYKSMKNPILRELMSNGLILAMTFMDLVLNSNPKSLQALNESSKRKLKTEK